MSELFLSVFGVAAGISFIFYRLGYTQGHRAAHCLNATRSMAELEKAVSNASQVLKSERERADFYKTLHHTDVKESIVTHEILGEIFDFLRESRCDVVEADTFNREMLQKINRLQLFNKTNLLMIGETLQRSELKLTSEEYNEIADDYYKRDKEEIVGDIEFASKIASRKREQFMESIEPEILG